MNRDVDGQSFSELVDVVRKRVDARLVPWLAPRLTAAAAVSAEVGTVAQTVSELTLRGGKRLRAALVAVGWAAVTDADWAPCEPAMLAYELLQTYLLIHDDWMDDDPVRRGGPAVHVLLRERLGRTLGDAGAILAGDLASAYAQEALLSSEVAPEHLLRAVKTFARTQVDVVCGQLAEMRAPGRTGPSPNVETIHALKTASYTVTGPLLLGAALAGADDVQAAALERFALPVGIAFQLRDDLLGVFGDPTATGKPVWNDIRQGKETALVAAMGDPGLLARITPDSPDADVEAIVRRMEESGARARVEARVRELCGTARGAVDEMKVGEPARAWLLGAVTALGERAS